MLNILTPAEMREMERTYLSDTDTPSLALMERAASELTELIISRFGARRTAYFACGSGGNGGDGYASARLYREAGGNAVCIEVSPPKSADAIINRRRFGAAITVNELKTLPAPDLWVDAIFGTGLSRRPTGAEAETIALMKGAPVIAADVPSGLDALTGHAFEPCVHADITACFGAYKTGLMLNDGLDVCGDIELLGIGIPDSYTPKSAMLITPEDVTMPPEPRNIHKGARGRLLIIAGSYGMAGAAYLCASAAIATGAGLTTIACPDSIVDTLQTLAPLAMCAPMPEENGALSDAAVMKLVPLIEKCDAICIGCGLSPRCSKEIVRLALTCGKPAVFDADALNIISSNAELFALLDHNHVITPHIGEAARLLKRDVCDMLADARELSRTGATVVLKSAASVIACGEDTYISKSGCSGMAKGGSGDALSGMIAALIMRRDADMAFMAARACELHGMAGEAAQKKHGRLSMTPEHLIGELRLGT